MSEYYPVIVTIIGNILFYVFVKRDIDSQANLTSIAYSEIFKEKIIIYRELLGKVKLIREQLKYIKYNIEHTNSEKIESLINNMSDFINFYEINKPFLSNEMITDLQSIKDHFKSNAANALLLVEIKKEGDETKINEVLMQLRNKKTFENLESKLVTEMRNDLQMNNFGNHR